MKILIAGDGKVGSIVSKTLSREGHDIVLIDMNDDALAMGADKYDIMSVKGNCASMSTLKQAGVEDAELLIAVTSMDEINLLSCLTAHCINPELHTIARIRNPEYVEQAVAMKNAFALSLVVNPERQAAREISNLIRYPGFLKRDTFAKGRVQIVELKVEEDSPLCNVSLMSLGEIIKCKVLVCAVLRDGKAMIPGGNFVLQAGDRLHVAAAHQDIKNFFRAVGQKTAKIKNVLICGGGRLCFYLAAQLIQAGMQVKIIERNEARCEELSDRFPRATIIHGDATDHELLLEEGIQSADAFVAITNMDEENIIMSLYAKSQGVPKIVAKVNEDSRAQMVEGLGIDSIVSTKSATADTIMNYVRARMNSYSIANVEAISQLLNGKVEALEFMIKKECEFTNIPLKELRTKKDYLIACIGRGRKVIIPNGDDHIEVGDNVVVVTKNRGLDNFTDILA